MSSVFHVRCIGIPAVFVGKTSESLALPRSGLQLLLFLCTSPGHRVLRDDIIDELWPDVPPDKAASRLTSALWRLRKALRIVKLDHLVEILPEGALRLRLDEDVEIDIRTMDLSGRRFLAAENQLKLPDVFVRSAEGADQVFHGWYAPWALRERLRLENLTEHCLHVQLERQIAAGELVSAVETARHLLDFDPLLEDVHEALIDIFLGLGRPGMAKRQLDLCTGLLDRELGVAPSPRLAEKISRACTERLSVPKSVDLAALGRLLRRSARDLKKASDRLEVGT